MRVPYSSDTYFYPREVDSWRVRRKNAKGFWQSQDFLVCSHGFKRKGSPATDTEQRQGWASVMRLTAQGKSVLKREPVAHLRTEKEVQKIVIFGSFLHSGNPHDLNVAVFQDSIEPYLPLALKYRQNTPSIARRIPLDILPPEVLDIGRSVLGRSGQRRGRL
jgi:hypothetical protein